jgi:hypothetical protein
MPEKEGYEICGNFYFRGDVVGELEALFPNRNSEDVKINIFRPVDDKGGVEDATRIIIESTSMGAVRPFLDIVDNYMNRRYCLEHPTGQVCRSRKSGEFRGCR